MYLFYQFETRLTKKKKKNYSESLASFSKQMLNFFPHWPFRNYNNQQHFTG